MTGVPSTVQEHEQPHEQQQQQVLQPPIIDMNQPNDDWTIEELLEWCLQQANHVTEVTYHEIEKDIMNDFDKECETIWETFHRCQKNQTLSPQTTNNNDNNNHEQQQQHEQQLQSFKSQQNDYDSENIHPNPYTKPSKTHHLNLYGSEFNKLPSINESGVAVAADTVTATMGTNSTLLPTTMCNFQEDATVRVDVMGGPYIGKVYYLKPTSRAAAMIGRSTSKKFKDRGISLSKDGEVSTSHGKIEKLQDEYYYTDTGSTNGSTLMKDTKYKIPAHEPVLLPSNSCTTLIIGTTTLQITVY